MSAKTMGAGAMKLWMAVLGLVAILAGHARAAETVTYYVNGERLTNAPASVDNKVWFTSRRQDADTGLVYMGARYYSPVHRPQAAAQGSRRLTRRGRDRGRRHGREACQGARLS